jgi:Flp pilus assembly protein TadG
MRIEMKFRRRQQAGAVMVEMVAVTPLLLLLLLGVGEIGKALIEYNTLNVTRHDRNGLDCR